MQEEWVTIIVRLLFALGAGALIGLERTYHGRPAGFRTHALVATASCLLMFVALFYEEMSAGRVSAVTIDPTRMAQGIMTGIGFLGAGVILREELTIHGITTAASIWMTEAIDIVVGMGLYVAGGIAVGLALVTLAWLGWLETKAPMLRYDRLTVRFRPSAKVTESKLVEVVTQHGMKFNETSYFMDSTGPKFEMTIRKRDVRKIQSLSAALTAMDDVAEFSIIPMGG
ncbi:MAG: MgtC/SapB family protein [SAR202 cluster bacterium]|nr:MgtC/SapB family protein [SAR202 cluster bacterium]